MQIMALAMINGLITSILLETVILKLQVCYEYCTDCVIILDERSQVDPFSPDLVPEITV